MAILDLCIFFMSVHMTVPFDLSAEIIGLNITITINLVKNVLSETTDQGFLILLTKLMVPV